MVDSDQSDTEPEKDGQQNHVFPISKTCQQTLAATPQPRAKGLQSFCQPGRTPHPIPNNSIVSLRFYARRSAWKTK
jgi:pyruvate/2-oxoglutarate dehydrogenase complex dihydrolipoamide acyltransferase (E2) component